MRSTESDERACCSGESTLAQATSSRDRKDEQQRRDHQALYDHRSDHAAV
jgi:hypothetical protein